MADQNRQEVRRMLVEKRDALDLELSNKTKEIITSGTDNEIKRVLGDSGDQADQNNSDYMEDSLIRLKSKTLEKLNEAIRRFDEGTYGICSDCEIDISPKRLEALPFATRCKGCQEREESRQGEDAERKHRSRPLIGYDLGGPY